jgi:hypothetical protein
MNPSEQARQAAEVCLQHRRVNFMCVALNAVIAMWNLQAYVGGRPGRLYLPLVLLSLTGAAWSVCSAYRSTRNYRWFLSLARLCDDLEGLLWQLRNENERKN